MINYLDQGWAQWLKLFTGSMMVLALIVMLGWAAYDTVTRPPSPVPPPPIATPIPQLNISELQSELFNCVIVREGSVIIHRQCFPKNQEREE